MVFEQVSREPFVKNIAAAVSEVLLGPAKSIPAIITVGILGLAYRIAINLPVGAVAIKHSPFRTVWPPRSVSFKHLIDTSKSKRNVLMERLNRFRAATS